MKKYIVLFLLFGGIVSTTNAQIKIQGTVKHYKGECLTLSYYEGKHELIDTLQVGKSGKFVYQHDQHLPASLSVMEQKTPLYLEPGDQFSVVIDLKKDAIANVVLNTLLKHTALQTSFGVNNIALVGGRPRLLNLKDLIRLFVEHRHDVITRRTRFELKQAEDRAHILEGLIIASDHIDEVIRIIRASKTPDEAKNNLIERFSLTEIQARAIVEMRLRQLTGLEQDKLRAEYDDIMKLIEHLKEILASLELRMQIIKEELLQVKAQYSDERKTDIVYASEEFNPEDFYADEEMVITISHMGYIKRTPLSEYKVQNRGGVGSKGSATRDEDFLEHMIMATMHNTMLFFTEKGKCFWLKVWEIPEGTKQSKGRAIQNLLNIEPDDKVKAYINILNLKDEEYINNNYIVCYTTFFHNRNIKSFLNLLHIAHNSSHILCVP